MKTIRKFLILAIIIIIIMSSTPALASSEGNIKNDSFEHDAVNEYLNSLGYSDLPADAVCLMENSFTVNRFTSDWEVLVNYVTCKAVPEGLR